jgi:hypothetical protein
MFNSCSPPPFSLFPSLPDVLAFFPPPPPHVVTPVFLCKSKGHFVVFLILFSPKTDLLKGGGGGGHSIRNPLIFGFLVKDDILQFFAR